MASIDRTAYPHFRKQLNDKELSNRYGLNDEEQDFIHRYARNDRGYLVLSVILKTRQQLGYFAALQDIPDQIVTHISAQLEVDPALWQPDEAHYGCFCPSPEIVKLSHYFEMVICKIIDCVRFESLGC